jgi:acyl-homoserine lactone acylase PvdQ
VAAVALSMAIPAAASAAPQPQPYQTNDFLGFRDILPPGTNGFVNLVELAAFELNGTRPPHNDDQLSMYEDLVYDAPGLTMADLDRFYTDGSFGVQPDNVERTYSPRDDVTIVRDEAFGIPHIYGENRDGAMFGIGYASAEDRLFFMDALRHSGRGKLSSFAGGANRDMDRSVWADTPYTEEDLQRQIDYSPPGLEEEADQLRRDATNYVAGINKYISEARLNPTKMPGEYAAIGRPLGPTNWKLTDLIAEAALVGGIFGKGGGNELGSGLVLQKAQEKFGATGGERVWKDFRSAEDPDAPLTVTTGKRFPYQTKPDDPKGVALPDPGTVQRSQVVAGESPLPGAGSLTGILGPILDLLGGSNALLVSRAESQSGHPVAVMGPQVSYFQPEILIHQDVHAPASSAGPAIDARGAAFPGVNLYVQLGRGRDYSWSATSAGQDVVDTFAVDLCEPGGGQPTIDSDHYMFRGQCLPFEVLEQTNSWTPNAGDPSAPGSETLRTLRSKLGIVIARAERNGKPIAYTKLRTTYFHEVDSALGFSKFNDPNAIQNVQDFQRAASDILFTFNWLYADNRDIGYFNSGANPVRATNADQNLPLKGSFEWKDYDPDTLTERVTPFSQHPQVVNQPYITSWNNKQARGYHAADDQWGYSSTYRSRPLDNRIESRIAGSRKIDLPGLVDSMEDAGTVDLRGAKVLGNALRLLKSKPIADPDVADAVQALQAWHDGGAHRIDRDQNGTYEDAEAIRIMDAWWPRWMHAEFEPTLGEELFDAVEGMIGLDNEPNNHGGHLGSAYQSGFYGYARKDLRTLLGKPVDRRYSRVYCGKGKTSTCRQALLDSLAEAIQVPYDTVYPETSGCSGGDRQWCFDAIRFRPTGAVSQPFIHWINRPTYQQAVEIQGHRPR